MSYLKLTDDAEFNQVESDMRSKYGIPIGFTTAYSEKVRADDGRDYMAIATIDEDDLTAPQKTNLVERITVTE